MKTNWKKWILGINSRLTKEVLYELKFVKYLQRTSLNFHQSNSKFFHENNTLKHECSLQNLLKNKSPELKIWKLTNRFMLLCRKSHFQKFCWHQVAINNYYSNPLSQLELLKSRNKNTSWKLRTEHLKYLIEVKIALLVITIIIDFFFLSFLKEFPSYMVPTICRYLPFSKKFEELIEQIHAKRNYVAHKP